MVARLRWCRAKAGVVTLALLFPVAFSAAAAPDSDEAEPWIGPPAKFISALGEHEHRYTYNTISSPSGDGRFVVFVNHIKDRPERLFFRDVSEDKAEMLLKPPADFERKGLFGGYISAPQLSWDGRFVTFSTDYQYLKRDDDRHTDVYRYDIETEDFVMVSRGDDGSADRDAHSPSASPDGRFVAFASGAANLVEGDSNKATDVFVRDIEGKTTVRVSVADDGSQAEPSPIPGYDDRLWGDSYLPAISSDGSRVAFVSYAANLVEDDTNQAADAFVRDIATGDTIRVSVSSSGEQLEPFVYGESAGTFRDGVDSVAISGSGDVVAFNTHANGLVEEDTNNNVDVYVHLPETGETTRVSVTSEGEDAYGPENRECGANGQCFGFISSHTPSISEDGRFVAFVSGAPKLGEEPEDDPSDDQDVYVHDLGTRVTRLVSRKRTGDQATNANLYPGHISFDGRWISFATDAGKMNRKDNFGGDVFLQRLKKVNFER